METEYDVERLLGEFAEHLLQTNLAMKTATGYLSGIRTKLRKRFKNLRKFNHTYYPHNKSGNPKWYSEIYSTLEKKKVEKVHDKGKSVINQSDPVTRKNIIDSSRALLILNKPKRTKQRAQLVILWSALGRAMELALTTWNGMFFDGHEIDFHWKEQKTVSALPMRYPKDRHNFECCPIHSLACYLIVFDGDFRMTYQEDESIMWLFPDLKRESNTYISNMMTNLLKWLKEEGLVDGLPPNPCIHGVRRGGATQLALDPDVQDIEWCVRGGWGENAIDKKAELADKMAEMTMIPKNANRYVALVQLVSLAGLKLHKYKNCKRCPLAPTTETILTEEDTVQVNTLINVLFCANDCEFLREKGHLRPLTHTMFAVVIMDLKELELCCVPPEKNKIAQKIIQQACTLGIERNVMYEWGT